MATLQEQFEQAQQAARLRRESPLQVQARASFQRLDALHAEATTGDSAGREAAIRQYIQLVGDLGQQAG
jgi:hypothetical protein